MPAIRPAKVSVPSRIHPNEGWSATEPTANRSVWDNPVPPSPDQPSRHKVNPPPYAGINDRPSSSHTYKYPICPKPPSNASLGECPTVRLPQAPLVPYRHPPPFSRKATSRIHPTCARLPPVPGSYTTYRFRQMPWRTTKPPYPPLFAKPPGALLPPKRVTCLPPLSQPPSAFSILLPTARHTSHQDLSGSWPTNASASGLQGPSLPL